MKKIRNFLSEYYIVISILCLSLYFTYHIFYSNRGYLRLKELRKETEEAILISKDIKDHRDSLTHKVSLLSNKSLNLDLVDEMIRQHLNMAEKDEYIILK